MAAPIDIRFEFAENVTAAYDRAIAAGSDFTPAMMAIATHLETTTRLRFETETDPDGKRWIPSRRAIEEGGQTLTLTGDLKTSIGSGYGRDFAEAGPERSFGAAIYAAVHQFGAIIRAVRGRALSFGGQVFAAVRIPARPYLGFSAENRAFIPEAIVDHLRGAFVGGRA